MESLLCAQYAHQGPIRHGATALLLWISPGVASGAGSEFQFARRHPRHRAQRRVQPAAERVRMVDTAGCATMRPVQNTRRASSCGTTAFERGLSGNAPTRPSILSDPAGFEPATP